MKTIKCYTISSISDGLASELFRTPFAVIASAFFIHERNELTEEGKRFTLFMSMVHETIDENGNLISITEREIDSCNENGFVK